MATWRTKSTQRPTIGVKPRVSVRDAHVEAYRDESGQVVSPTIHRRAKTRSWEEQRRLAQKRARKHRNRRGF